MEEQHDLVNFGQVGEPGDCGEGALPQGVRPDHDLGDVVGVLLDPPRHGFASLVEEAPDGRREFRVWFRAADERKQRPVAWRVEEQQGRQRITQVAQDGVLRQFRGSREVEQASGRPDFVAHPLHLLLPMKAYFWGRPGDDWRLTPQVRTDGDLAVVRLVGQRAESAVDAQLVVDMVRRLAVSYVRPSSTLTLTEFEYESPEVPFDRV